MTTLVAQVQFLAAALLLSPSLAQYDTYESAEEDDREDSPPEDYSRYYAGSNGVSGAVNGPSPLGISDASGASDSGFVQPLDFSGIFTGANFALDGIAGGASQQVFSRPSTSLGLGFGGPSPPANSTGFFSNDVNFRSLFDTSGSPSESGFRSGGFLPGGAQAGTASRAFLSPAFSSLKHDVDREVGHQSRESTPVIPATPGAYQARSRAAVSGPPDDEDSEEFDPSSYESEEAEERSPQRYPRPYEDPRGGGPQSSSHYERGGSPYKGPATRGPSYYEGGPTTTRGEPRYHYQSESRPNRKHKPLPAAVSEEDEDDEPQQRHSKSYKGYHINAYPSVRPAVNSYPKPHSSQYKKSNKPPKPKTFYSNSQYGAGPPKAPQYKPRPGFSPSAPHSTRSYPNTPADFRPSPRDPYLDPHASSPHSVTPVSPPYKPLPSSPHPDAIYPLPQTGYATVVRKQPALVAAATENKSCRKIQKDIDPGDFSRFKRQQMTCYICTDREKGNKYEECSYESQPKSGSYYKGSQEAYTAETISPKKTFSARDRRSIQLFAEGKNHYTTRSRRSVSFSGADHNLVERSPRVKRQERYYPAKMDEQGHGNQHYRFGPVHFRRANRKGGNLPVVNKKTRRNYDEEDYGEYEHDDDEEEDVEREYSPPGASDSDRCHRVEKDNGLTCMVCENPKSGGSYQQCSYASEPDKNRYEYARQTSYGKKSPKSDRYKRMARAQVDRGAKRYGDKTRRGESQKNHHGSIRRSDDFRDGKMKRKKVREADYQKRPVRYSVSKSKHYKQNKNDGIVGLDPFFYGSPGKRYNPDDYDSRGKKIKRKVQKNKKTEDDGVASATSSEDYADDEEEDEDDPTYEESFYRLFPELVGVDPYTGERQGQADGRDGRGEDRNFDHPPIPYEEAEDEEESESVRKDSKVKPVYEYGADLPGYFNDEESKKDLEKALDEFTHKNRSECKKVLKDHMTCYQCLDAKGMQHEECMYVAASEPKKKHLAYHEVKEFKITPAKVENPRDRSEEGTETLSETEQMPSKVSQFGENNEGLKAQNWRNQPPNVYDQREVRPALQPGGDAMPDNEGQATVSYDILKPSGLMKSKKLKKTKKTPSENKDVPRDFMITAESRTRSVLVRQEEDTGSDETKRDDEEDNKEDEAREEKREEEGEEEAPEKRQNYNPIPPDPEGFYDREGPEGAYTHETEPVFDSVLKITLPKYMLTKSEHEEIFDEVLRSG